MLLLLEGGFPRYVLYPLGGSDIMAFSERHPTGNPTGRGTAVPIEVDRSTCVRSNQCSYLHPELFDRDSDDYPVPKVKRPVDAAEREAIDEAIDLCPVGAIAYQEEDDD
jgi:ferredoxin